MTELTRWFAFENDFFPVYGDLGHMFKQFTLPKDSNRFILYASKATVQLRQLQSPWAIQVGFDREIGPRELVSITKVSIFFH